jgi:hypothetical protein
MGDRKVACRILVARSEGKRPLERLTRRWDHNIKMDLQGLECGTYTGVIWLRIGTGSGLL